MSKVKYLYKKRISYSVAYVMSTTRLKHVLDYVFVFELL